MSQQLRPATAGDIDAILLFNQRLAQETEGKSLDDSVLRSGIAALLADPNKGIYYVVEIRGEVVGQLMITQEWSDWRNGWMWWIQSVYVRSDARQQGVFRQLYEHIQQEAREREDVVGIRLYVEKENAIAQQTYQRLGMALTDYLVMEQSTPSREG